MLARRARMVLTAEAVGALGAVLVVVETVLLLEVAVHLVQANVGWGRMALEALRSGFRFDAMMARVAREDRRSTDEIVAAVKDYTDLGFTHLVVHAPGDDQERFLRTFADAVLPGLRELRPGALAA